VCVCVTYRRPFLVCCRRPPGSVLEGMGKSDKRVLEASNIAERGKLVSGKLLGFLFSLLRVCSRREVEKALVWTEHEHVFLNIISVIVNASD